jgi:hypothetical protein
LFVAGHCFLYDDQLRYGILDVEMTRRNSALSDFNQVTLMDTNGYAIHLISVEGNAPAACSGRCINNRSRTCQDIIQCATLLVIDGYKDNMCVTFDLSHGNDRTSNIGTCCSPTQSVFHCGNVPQNIS